MVSRASIVTPSGYIDLPEFASFLAHEVRSPLTVILWCTTSLKKQATDETTRETLEDIRYGAERIVGITDALVGLTKGGVECEPLAVYPLVSGQVQRFMRIHAERPIELVCTPDLLALGISTYVERSSGARLCGLTVTPNYRARQATSEVQPQFVEGGKSLNGIPPT